MKLTIVPICPICDSEMASDAGAKSYCRLCGMGMREIGKRWCNGCEERFTMMVHYEKA